MDNNTNISISTITTLPASRELDKMVAEKVMGWTKISTYHKKGKQGYENGKWKVELIPIYYGHTDCDDIEIVSDIPSYSSDIGAAWTVLEKMIQRIENDVTRQFCFHPPMCDLNQDIKYKWYVFYDLNRQVKNDEWRDSDCVYANSAPLAICRAALAVVELEDKLKGDQDEQ